AHQINLSVLCEYLCALCGLNVTAEYAKVYAKFRKGNFQNDLTEIKRVDVHQDKSTTEGLSKLSSPFDFTNLGPTW
ncbi:MAG TPA: hypothetical protein VI731_12305, partial [Bacteroidia bacterium]|nr:hypothetical protein [Bacteroidia bacterium]